jgi:hypothetical protein
MVRLIFPAHFDEMEDSVYWRTFLRYLAHNYPLHVAAHAAEHRARAWTN